MLVEILVNKTMLKNTSGESDDDRLLYYYNLTAIEK